LKLNNVKQIKHIAIPIQNHLGYSAKLKNMGT